MQVLASQLLFLANRNAGLAISPLFWPINCIKIGGHVARLSDPTVNCLYCAITLLNTTAFSDYSLHRQHWSSIGRIFVLQKKEPDTSDTAIYTFELTLSVSVEQSKVHTTYDLSSPTTELPNKIRCYE